MSDPDMLPDSRPREVKQVKSMWFNQWGRLNMVPIYCANCGKLGAYTFEENCTFACWLCDPCAETYGPIAGTMMMPDEVYWRKVHAEQVEKYGHVLTEQEVIETSSSWGAMAKLLRESPFKPKP